MVEATLQKFGYPTTLVARRRSWAVLCRPQQPTLGSLVLICLEPVQAFGEVSPAAFAELQIVVKELEAALAGFVGYSKMNYLMLMMVDPDVHFHVIPRYEGSRSFGGLSVTDAGWPGPPALAPAAEPDAAELEALVAELRRRWPSADQSSSPTPWPGA
ncbi:HIT family protein [Roseomonas elaeocarpi]|uniref:HIT family protein n=1 Tax=Roseomonas elaeocarpi TaxID=907779 RepID=A0ABV6JQN6_9PROT